MKKTIALLYGGRSGEHEVSRVSAASIARNLDPTKYATILIGIAYSGLWYLQGDEELERVRAGSESINLVKDDQRLVTLQPGGGPANALRRIADNTAIPVDIVFPVLHGTYGEDGTIQGLFEMANLPYVGSGVLGSAVAMDKEKTKALWIHAGLPTVPYLAVKKCEWKQPERRLAIEEKAERDFRYPVFVKPACAGSSVGAGKAENRADLDTAVEAALRWDDKVLIEPFVKAREIECSVTGNDKVSVYTPGEVAPANTHEFYDYEAKYIDPDGAALLIPADLPEDSLRIVREVALKAYKALDLTGLARVDFFVKKETGDVYLNEVNTMPGFTTISMFPKMCEASGLSYKALLDHLIALAEERHEARSARSYQRN